MFYFACRGEYAEPIPACARGSLVVFAVPLSSEYFAYIQIKDDLVKAERKKEIEALKQKKKEIDAQLKKSMISMKYGGEGRISIRYI